MNNTFPFKRQLDVMDCGPTCLHMIAKYYGKEIPIQILRERAQVGKEGVSFLGLSEAAESLGFRTIATKLSIDQLKEDANLPCIVHWNQNHFVVVYDIRSSLFKERKTICIANPSRGLLKYSEEEFCKSWFSDLEDGKPNGIALLMEPTPLFYELKLSSESRSKNINRLFSYLKPYSKLFIQVFIALFIGSLLQLILPFLTRNIVDLGVNSQNVQFIYVLLIAQLTLFIGRTLVDFFRSWILLHISSRINISILTDFVIKLMQLPVSFFDTKMTGDIMQRMNDHRRIEKFLTKSALTTIFSLVNLIIFSVVLILFNFKIFLTFFIGSLLYTIWVLLFLKKRAIIDYKQFNILAKEQSKTIELIQGMQEIKLHNSERAKRWEWERLQASLFQLNFKILGLAQFQQAGALCINEGKNIIITFLAAKAVIDGQISLGTMLAIQYIIGQLNSPIENIVEFIQSWQDANIGITRLNEIHNLDNEEKQDLLGKNDINANQEIEIKNLTFQYPGAGNKPVFTRLNLNIPHGRTTAIVGASGSGKTTLLKLLLKFYSPQEGGINLGNLNIERIKHSVWRSNFGVVLQDSFIFSDTLAKNIAVGEEKIDLERLSYAVAMANIEDFVESLPLRFNTKLGLDGVGISQGQKQRLLIARAIYKNPSFMLFDEATNSLDANNEKVILKNLNKFFKNRTVIVVAHRLSTVKNADQIVVLNKGIITELGTHDELICKKGEYFTLVKNQLEIGAE